MTTPSRFLARLFAAGTLAAAFAAIPAPAAAYGGLVVFGDSLSDIGNNTLVGLYDPTQVVTGNGYIPTDTYAPSGTYSNGPVWASYFASALGLALTPSLAGGTDYAAGGARLGTAGSGPGGYPYSLLAQTQLYLAAGGGSASADALYVVAGGGNDARDALAAIAGGADPMSTVGAAAATFAAGVGTIVGELQAAGAQHIVVWNTPNIGLVPAVASLGAAASATGSFVAGAMNAALAAQLGGVGGVTIFDFYGFQSARSADPGAYGFANATDACGAVAGADCSGYLYWDGIHPTTAAHQALAAAVTAALPVPEPQTWALMLAGLGAVGVGARRRARRAAAVPA